MKKTTGPRIGASRMRSAQRKRGVSAKGRLRNARRATMAITGTHSITPALIQINHATSNGHPYVSIISSFLGLEASPLGNSSLAAGWGLSGFRLLVQQTAL